MDTVAVICEYNPLHRGHALLFERARATHPSCNLVSVMSGNTVQRGDFALFDRYTRARAGILCGSDLVLELPYPYSCAASEQFASAGVRIAALSGAKYLIFGIGSDRTDELFEAAAILGSEEFRYELSSLARANPARSFLSLREELYRKYSDKPLPRDGNSSLGIEYIIAADRLRRAGVADITCEPFHRTAPFSATVCRELIRDGDSEEQIAALIPDEASALFRKSPVSGGLFALSDHVLAALRIMYATGMGLSHTDTDNGIRAALAKSAVKASNFEDFLTLLPTSTYTRARLRRELLDALLIPEIEDANALRNQPPPYSVLLGASDRGLSLLSAMRKSDTLPVITKPSDVEKLSEEAKRIYRLSDHVSALYSLTFSPSRPIFDFITRFKRDE